MAFIPNTFGLSVSADKFISWPAQAAQFDPEQAYLVVGSGSNLLFTEPAYHGQIIQVDDSTFEVCESESDYSVTLGGSLNWHLTVKRLLDMGIRGLENLALIPGTVGAAPIQNIGAYGVEFSQFCETVSGYNLKSGRFETLSASDCLFAYRDSIFKHSLKASFIVTQVTLKLTKNWQAELNYGPLQSLTAPTAIQVFNKVCEIRQAKLPDPNVLGNAGSFFKNPVVTPADCQRLLALDPDLPHFLQPDGRVKLAAGYLIDKAGLKGFELNRAQVHRQQALVIVNTGGASAADIVKLAALARQKVYQDFNVRITPEVRFIGATDELDSELVLEQIAPTGLNRTI